MSLTKDEVVRELAEWHFGVEPDLERVLRIVGDSEDAPEEPIKLLEVNGATVATGSVDAYGFKPTRSRPFAIVIVAVPVYMWMSRDAKVNLARAAVDPDATIIRA